MMESTHAEIVVIGAGPGGYAAAFYAADRGKKVVMVESEARLGGVCLNRGCIPSKALLHATKLIAEARDSEFRGITFAEPKLDLKRMRSWKESILDKLGQGISGLAQKRNVHVVTGRAIFEDSRMLRVETSGGQKFIRFDKVIVATGSRSALPKAFDLGNPRVMTSREALEIEEVPPELLIVGGGYIGMELGTVYATLGSKITVVEAMDHILAGADQDLIRPVLRYAERAFKEVRVRTKVTSMATSGKQIKVAFESEGHEKKELFDRVLIAVGRTPNCEDIGLNNTQVSRDEKGCIQVDKRQRTEDPNIYAIGDVVGGVMLAHKAAREARVAVDAILGEDTSFEHVVIPAVVFTDPEVAWCGLTEIEAKEANIPVEVAKFPWSASGRALSFDRPDGLTKLVIEPETERILGVGIVGAGAGELIGEGVLAVEMGATARDLAECVHPHPTLSETLMECAEIFYGQATHASGRRKASQAE